MGFGFNLFFIFILLPLIIILVIGGFAMDSRRSFKGIGYIGIFLIGLIILSNIIQFCTAKTVLKKSDYYGVYVVDKNFFKGKQADWQYNTYRFEIKKNDTIYFHFTQNDSILKTYKGTISTSNPYGSERLIINMIKPTHHILTTNPTIMRSAWDFNLVFNSPKFGNVFFKKE
jgi:hypothetical protein